MSELSERGMIMGMQALYLVEAKTRLILLEKEIAALVYMIEHADMAIQNRYADTLDDLRARFEKMEADLAFLHEIDDSEWGEFPSQLDAAIHKLIHDVSMVKSEFEAQLAFA